MRITIPESKDGDMQIRRKFLFFPKWADGQIRWLEYATWKEVCHIAAGETFWEFMYWDASD